MSKIFVAGLGFGSADALTRRAWEIISEHGEVWLRTNRHPVVKWLEDQGIKTNSYDIIYASYPTFAQVYQAIVTDLLEKARGRSVVYGVPGDPGLAEATVSMLKAQAPAYSVSIEIIPGVSFIEPVLNALDLGNTDEIQISDAQSFSKVTDPLRPYLFHQVWSKLIAAELKLKLLDSYPPEHTVFLISGAGLPGQRKEGLPLWELDHQTWIDHLTSLYVPPLEPCQSGPHFQALENILAYLRSQQGCPWDRQQTHNSLLPYLLEEAYELADAIRRQDQNKICEEMGDLLLQIVFLGQIASEAGCFKTGDAVRAITEKLIRRHPHVFADGEAYSAEEVIKIWQRVKLQEGKGKMTPLPALLGLEKAVASGRELPEDPLLAGLADLVLRARNQGRSLEAEVYDWLNKNE